MHTGRTPREDEGRSWVTHLQAKEPEIARKPPEAQGEAWNRLSLTPSGGTNATNTLTLDF